MGDDALVVNAARVSFNKEVSGDLSEKDGKLIEYLANHGHWTPFAHPQVCIREKVPIFVARQRFKHMVGFAYNEVSRRYVDDSPEFFTPENWRSRPTGGAKQGSGKAVGLGDEHVALNFLSHVHDTCDRVYKDLLHIGIAPEQARMVLPQSMYTEYYVTGSLAAWARAYTQRIDNHAQKEIQELAKQWNNLIAPLFPLSWKALTNLRVYTA